MRDMFIRPDAKNFLDLAAASGRAGVAALGVEIYRTVSRDNCAVLDLDRGELAAIRDFLVSGIEHEVPVRLYIASAHYKAGPILVFMHGGGWALGDLETHESVCAELARGLGIPVLSVAYRRAPEHPFPAAPDDCEAVARWIASTPEALGFVPTALVLAGDSAGGNLALVTAMALRDKPSRLPVVAQFLIYPLLGRAEEFPSYERFADGYGLTAESLAYYDRLYRRPRDDWRGTPAIGNFSDLPQTLVVTASLDPLRDEGRALVGWLASAGVPVTFREAVGNIHGFINFRRIIPSSVEDLAGCIKVLRAMISDDAKCQAP